MCVLSCCFSFIVCFEIMQFPYAKLKPLSKTFEASSCVCLTGSVVDD